ncbi:larval cuticle protein 65Ag1-like [Scaptodrosophila lebanonensis]|uniref:Larval cuticle protein 65Ag1-like n=1 Tax=Drosophila lebanonensis TaxID=7225 RepID=A0A6J2U907_DROLE|nr:larval cuticle protein 65Ag1-like [Scaptodrosophila lebanonensis]
MKFIIVFAALFAVVLAAPANPDADSQVLRSDSDVGPENYKYAYETSNGINAQEEGQLNNAGSENEAIAVRGSFTWVDPEGQSHTITYIADENGFQPQGADIPLAPEA